MDHAPRPATTEVDSGCALCLKALTGEVRTAIDAIAANEPGQLAESVARQEMLCCELVSLYRRAGQATASIQARTSVAAAEVAGAEMAWQLASLEYASLLRHSGKTIAMLTLLCNSYRGPIEETRGTRPGQPTWSCEM